MLAGFDGASQTQVPNAAAAYVPLKSFEERKKLGAISPPSWPRRKSAPPTSTKHGC